MSAPMCPRAQRLHYATPRFFRHIQLLWYCEVRQRKSRSTSNAPECPIRVQMMHRVSSQVAHCRSAGRTKYGSKNRRVVLCDHHVDAAAFHESIGVSSVFLHGIYPAATLASCQVWRFGDPDELVTTYGELLVKLLQHCSIFSETRTSEPVAFVLTAVRCALCGEEFEAQRARWQAEHELKRGIPPQYHPSRPHQCSKPFSVQAIRL